MPTRELESMSGYCKVCHDIGCSLSLDETLRLIVESVADFLKLKGCLIRLLDSQGKKMEIAASHGLSDAYRQKGVVELAKSQADQETLQGKIVVIDDVLSDPRIQYKQRTREEGIGSIAFIPLALKNRVIGVLRAYTEAGRHFSEEDLKLLVTFSFHGAVAIENARNYKKMQTLNEVARTIGSTLDLDKLLGLIVEQAALTMGIKGASIRLLDVSGKFLEAKAVYGLSRHYLDKGPVEVDRSLIDQEAISGKVVAVLDASKDPRYQYPEEAKAEGIKSVLCLPLSLDDRIIGVLRLYTGLPYNFTPEEIEFLCALASQSSIAIKNAMIYKRMHALYKVARSTSSTLNLQTVLDEIAGECASAMEVKGCSVMLLDREEGTLKPAASWGLSEDYLKKGPVGADKSLTECLDGQPVTVLDMENDSRIQYPEFAKKEGLRSMLSVPMMIKEGCIGVLRIYTARPRPFRPEEVEFLQTLSNQGAIAIENARLFEHVKKDYEDLSRDVLQWYDWGAKPPTL